MDVQIYVAAHKPYRMPADSMYIPLAVGAAGKEPLYPVTDATGDSISFKNASYCELTGLYWIWKNATADYLGLVHYRRHFAGRLPRFDRWKRIITRPQVAQVLHDAAVILPKPRHYWIETNWSQYVHAHHEIDLTQTRDCLTELAPEYLPAFDRVMRRTCGHRFNMLIMRRDVLDSYCAWLFPLLFRLEERLDVSAYSAYDARVFGFVGERLLDVWLEYNHVCFREQPVVMLEAQNWPVKIWRFLQRKFSRAPKE